MDDNKVLTLVSNERIPLSESMRMVFEIHSLKNATPATVSRAGILYINDTDIGHAPFVDSWLQSKLVDSDGKNTSATPLPLQYLFDKYLPQFITMLSKLAILVHLLLLHL